MRRIDVVRIEAGPSRGTGFLVARDRVLTALHVIGAAPPGDALVPHGRIVVRAAIADGAQLRERVEYVGADRVIAHDRELDWAVLAIDPAAFGGAPVLALGGAAGLAPGDPWATYGFPDGAAHDGKASAGTIASAGAAVRFGSARREVLQLYSLEAGSAGGGAVAGYSGGPVVVRGRAVGLISAAAASEGRSVEGTLYAVPLAAIAARAGLVLGPAGPPPLPAAIGEPPEPFRGLERYRRADARVLWGRDRDVLELLGAIERAEHGIVLVTGQTGTGKSSLLEAGALPRLEAAYDVRLERVERGDLAGAWARATGGDWLAAEDAAGRPRLVVIDQLEDAWRDDGAALERWLRDDLARCLAGGPWRPRGRLVLAFRKEWAAEIQQVLHRGGAGRWDHVHLRPLDRAAIVEVVHAVERHPGYQVIVAPGLGDRIADALLADPEAPRAPTLQVWLTELYAREPGPARHLTADGLDRLLRDGASLGDHLDRRIAACPREAAESGLALELLAFHVGPLATAIARTTAEVRAAYAHVADVEDTLGALERERLLMPLAAGGGRRLIHDTLAPVVLARVAASEKPAQRARAILDGQRGEWRRGPRVDDARGRLAPVLDAHRLEVVEAGRRAMRALDAEDAALVRASRTARVVERAARAAIDDPPAALAALLALELTADRSTVTPPAPTAPEHGPVDPPAPIAPEHGPGDLPATAARQHGPVGPPAPVAVASAARPAHVAVAPIGPAAFANRRDPSVEAARPVAPLLDRLALALEARAPHLRPLAPFEPTAIGISADGSTAALAALDGALWIVPRGGAAYAVQGVAGASLLAVSDDGAWIALGAPHAIGLVETRTGARTLHEGSAGRGDRLFVARSGHVVALDHRALVCYEPGTAAPRWHRRRHTDDAMIHTVHGLAGDAPYVVYEELVASSNRIVWLDVRTATGDTYRHDAPCEVRLDPAAARLTIFDGASLLELELPSGRIVAGAWPSRTDRARPRGSRRERIERWGPNPCAASQDGNELALWIAETIQWTELVAGELLRDVAASDDLCVVLTTRRVLWWRTAPVKVALVHEVELRGVALSIAATHLVLAGRRALWLDDDVLWACDLDTEELTAVARTSHAALVPGAAVIAAAGCAFALAEAEPPVLVASHSLGDELRAAAPAGDAIAACDEAGTLYLGDTRVGALPPAARGSVPAFGVSPDRRWLIAGSEHPNTDWPLHLWRLGPGGPPERRPVPLAAPNIGGAGPRFAFSLDGRWLATSCEDPIVLVWDVGTGEPALARDLIEPAAEHRGAIALGFRGDGRLAVVWHGGLVGVYDPTTGERLCHGRIDGADLAIVSPSGRWCVVEGHRARWLAPTDDVTRRVRLPAVEHERLVAIDDRARWLVASRGPTYVVAPIDPYGPALEPIDLGDPSWVWLDPDGSRVTTLDHTGRLTRRRLDAVRALHEQVVCRPE